MLSNILIKIPFTHLWTIKSSIKKASSLLDVGCGNGGLMTILSGGENWKIDGIDIFGKSLKKAKLTKTYKNLYKGNIVTILKSLVKKKKKYDVVFSSHVIEHLEKKDGQEMIRLMGILAKEKVVIVTPKGFMKQPDDLIEGNPYQYHKSGWEISEFKKMDFTVYGIGFFLTWSENGLGRSKNKIISLIFEFLSFLVSPIVYIIPELSAGLVTVKNIKNV